MILRDPTRASSQRYDVVVIGGGILGVCHLFEAIRRGLRALLLERDDFGGATSWASQRIIHGGLRYLQSLDLGRHRISVHERRWMLMHFPDQVRPLPCLMPLYDRGLKRRSMLRAALWLNDALSRGRNDGVEDAHAIPAGRLVSSTDTVRWFPGVARPGLRGGALWHDALMTSPQRVLLEWLRWSCHAGGTALNYVEANGLATRDGRVASVRAIDRRAGTEHVFETAWVINTAGPWAGSLAERLGNAPPSAIPLCLGYCVLLDRPAVSEAAVAVSPEQSGKPVYFLTPCQGRLLAGTAHLPWGDAGARDQASAPGPTRAQLKSFLDDLNRSVPGLDAGEQDVLRVPGGLLPATRTGSDTPSGRTTWIDHGRRGGPRGMLTVTGIKYTTARAVAARTLGMIFPGRPKALPERPSPRTGLDLSDAGTLPNPLTPPVRQSIRQLAEEESVMTPDDLMYRRTDWGFLPGHADRLRAEIASILGAARGAGSRHASGGD